MGHEGKVFNDCRGQVTATKQKKLENMQLSVLSLYTGVVRSSKIASVERRGHSNVMFLEQSNNHRTIKNTSHILQKIQQH